MREKNERSELYFHSSDLGICEHRHNHNHDDDDDRHVAQSVQHVSMSRDGIVASGT